MRKNLITVIILALCIVNLILNIVLVFVCMPSAQKTNNLITEIAAVLNLELTGNDGQPKVELAQVVNLKTDAGGEGHYVQFGITLGLDKSSDDYETLKSVLESAEGAVFDVARNVVQGYTYEEVTDQNTQDKIKKQILEDLQRKYSTTCIYTVSFSKFTTQ